ncbi:MAG: hypothetical protein FWC11_03415, partial [Firmicutes bacterium]|nr:hypothetical protein [Bacillota bacterium]
MAESACQLFSTVLLETATTWNNLNKGIEDLCQALSVPLSEIANTRTTPTNGSKTLVNSLRL